MRTTISTGRGTPTPHRARPALRDAVGLRPPGPIAATLFGQTRRQVLGLFFGRPDETFYVREVARITGGALGAVQRELHALVGAGILERAAKGRQVYYAANRQCPVFEELRAIVAKTSGLVDVLRAAFVGLSGRIDVAFVFGSMAKTGGTSASDVDVFVIGGLTLGETVDALARAQDTLGRDVNPVVQSASEFASRVARDDHFVARVLGEPRWFVIGDNDVLGSLGAKRVADTSHDKPTRDRRPATVVSGSSGAS